MNTTMEQKVWHETTVSNFPSLVDKYCTELGISKVPTPEYVSPDTALFYRRNKAGDYESVINYLRETRTYSLGDDYEEKFTQAELTFLYQRVYDPLTQEVVHLHTLPPSLHTKDLSFLGGPVEGDLGYKIASGLVNPQTHKVWDARTQTNSKSLPRLKRPPPQSFTPTQISVFHSSLFGYFFV